MKIHFHAADTVEAQTALKTLTKLYGQCDVAGCAVVVALGGDGTLLETVHKTFQSGKPVYGMNCGSVGFLLNPYQDDHLIKRIENAQSVTLKPLRMLAKDTSGQITEALAFNEVSLLRQSRQAAKLRIVVDGVERMDELVCDGILVATPAGSTAYNLSAHGPIVPLDANILAMTPISAFRPRRWRGALLPAAAHITLDILEADKRPVSATADYTEVRNVTHVTIEQDNTITTTLLHDPDHSMEERVLKEQFSS